MSDVRSASVCYFKSFVVDGRAPPIDAPIPELILRVSIFGASRIISRRLFPARPQTLPYGTSSGLKPPIPGDTVCGVVLVVCWNRQWGDGGGVRMRELSFARRNS
ncbi:hypothetical protein EVAR_69664_1 [Eumeta japonica]|uniref:Uncharacterized protein n=1 Tax=Eumeta variegata TaxID=151549 RepID=A0A4C1ZPG2_EUMVA|nr:hypothetical protein EVAR_69664_1 [Eumeta japonica]